MATNYWTGAAGDADMANPGNWSLFKVPQPGDDYAAPNARSPDFSWLQTNRTILRPGKYKLPDDRMVEIAPEDIANLARTGADKKIPVSDSSGNLLGVVDALEAKDGALVATMNVQPELLYGLHLGASIGLGDDHQLLAIVGKRPNEPECEPDVVVRR